MYPPAWVSNSLLTLQMSKPEGLAFLPKSAPSAVFPILCVKKRECLAGSQCSINIYRTKNKKMKSSYLCAWSQEWMAPFRTLLLMKCVSPEESLTSLPQFLSH